MIFGGIFGEIFALRRRFVALAMALACGFAGCLSLPDRSVDHQGTDSSYSGASMQPMPTGLPPQTIIPGGGAPASPPPPPPPPPIPVTVSLPQTGLTAQQLALIVNTSDPQSVAVADYYQTARQIPAANRIEVSFTPGTTDLDSATFTALKAQVDAALPAGIEAFAITWTYPFRVDECMSITSAFTFGYNSYFCSTNWPVDQDGCKDPTTENDAYYRSDTVSPFEDLGLRPAMMIAGATAADAEALIDQGVAADGSFPTADAYLYRTTDAFRNTRWGEFARLAGLSDYTLDPDNPADVYTASPWSASTGVTVQFVDNSTGTAAADNLTGASDVLIYETGAMLVSDIQTNSYLPGSLGDQLTSYAGVLNGVVEGMNSSGTQSTVLNWLASAEGPGVTASYGTVVEPCTYPSKFPDTVRLLSTYYRGATALEAYWKSVYAPYEGLVVGEPLARPFGNMPLAYQNGTLTIQTTALLPGQKYEVDASALAAGPYAPAQVGIQLSNYGLVQITIPDAQGFYQLVPTPAGGGSSSSSGGGS